MKISVETEISESVKKSNPILTGNSYEDWKRACEIDKYDKQHKNNNDEMELEEIQ